MDRVALYRDIRSDDIEVFNALDPDGWECEARQLSGGSAGIRIEFLELPSLVLCCFHYRAAMHFMDKSPENWLVFRGWFQADAPPNYQGSIMELDDAVVSTEEIIHEYTIRPNMHSFEISVKPEVAAQLGWNQGGRPPLIQTPRNSMQHLGIFVRKALDLAQSWGNVEPSPRTVMTLQNRVLSGLETAMQPWLQPSASTTSWSHSTKRSYHLVKQAEAWRASLDPDEAWTATTMAAGVFASERTLHRAFKTWANVGPGRYFALQKIHDFRKCLLSGDASRGAITRAAMASEFDHFGRLSVDYKKLFGEMPSETLHRFAGRM